MLHSTTTHDMNRKREQILIRLIFGTCVRQRITYSVLTAYDLNRHTLSSTNVSTTAWLISVAYLWSLRKEKKSRKVHRILSNVKRFAMNRKQQIITMNLSWNATTDSLTPNTDFHMILDNKRWACNLCQFSGSDIFSHNSSNDRELIEPLKMPKF